MLALLKWIEFFISFQKWFPKGVTNFFHFTEALRAWNDCSDLLYFVVEKPELLVCHPYTLFPQCINDYTD